MPLVMLLGAAILAVGLLYVDRRVDPGAESAIAWAYSGGPEGARSLLSTIAGSMITAATVTFSLAAVALSIASQQYGSRVLRNFMRDRVTQVLLGTFTATFIYSVLVVRAIRSADFSGGFVPEISVTVAIGLTLASLILLIYFIHHISSSIQAAQILHVIGSEIEKTIPRLYPETGEWTARGAEDKSFRTGRSATAVTGESGYLQTIDLDRLFNIAKHHKAVIEVTIQPGDHAVAGSGTAQVWAEQALPEEELKRVAGAFLWGGERTPEQDIRYRFQQLTDVVIRALSPGINDPFTAINGIDELASGISLMARRPRSGEARQDEQGETRLIAPRPRVTEVLENAIEHIAIYAAEDKFVMASLRRVLDIVESDLEGEAEAEVLLRLRAGLNRREKTKA